MNPILIGEGGWLSFEETWRCPMSPLGGDRLSTSGLVDATVYGVAFVLSPVSMSEIDLRVYPTESAESSPKQIVSDMRSDLASTKLLVLQNRFGGEMFKGNGGTGLLGARPEFWPHKQDDLGTRGFDTPF